MDEDLKKETADYLEQWKANGGETAFFACAHCSEILEVPKPMQNLVTAKGFWDSTKICTECGLLNHVCVYPDGKTKVKKVADYHYSAKEGQEGKKKK